MSRSKLATAVRSACVEMLEGRLLFDVTVSQVKDILDGTGSGFSGIASALGSTLFFVGNNAKGRELWSSNGTSDGTKIVKDIAQGNVSSDPAFFTKIGSRIYFVAGDASSDREIWYTDGTATKKVSNLQSSPSDLIAVDDVLFFLASVNGTYTLHRLKGDNVSAIPMPPSDENILPLAAVDGKLLFRYSDNANTSDNVHNTEVWVVNKSGDNPHLLKDLAAGDSSNPYGFVTVNDTVYFLAQSGKGNNRTTRLFQTDGTANGTAQVKNFGATFPGSFDSAAEVGGELFFGFRPGGGVNELWKADPTTGDATLIKKFSSDGSILGITEVGGDAFFSALNAKGRELWTSDGETAELVRDINENGDGSPGQFVNFNGTVYFSADDGTNGRELWSSDGTDDGTTLVKDIDPGDSGFGPNSSFPGFSSGFMKVGTSLYFGAITAASGQELYRLSENATCACSTFKVEAFVNDGDQVSIIEGDTVRFRMEVTGGEAEEVAWDLDDDGEYDDSFLTNPHWKYANNPDRGGNAIIVGLRVKNLAGDVAKAAVLVNVYNAAPRIREIIAVPVGSYFPLSKRIPPGVPFVFAARYKDPARAIDKHEAAWDFDDGTVTKYESAEPAATEIHTFENVGVYSVKVSIRDKDDGYDTQQRTFAAIDAEVFHQGTKQLVLMGGETGTNLAVTLILPPGKRLQLQKTADTQRVEVTRNGKSLGEFDAKSILIFGLGGNDKITVDPRITIPTQLDGGNGNDTIRGGSGKDEIVGGKGNDAMFGRGGADQLTGGKGDDEFDGGKGKDEIVDPENAAAFLGGAVLFRASTDDGSTSLHKLAPSGPASPFSGLLRIESFVDPDEI